MNRESMDPESTSKTLRRIFAHGRLIAMPKRPSDQELLLAMAASRFDAQRGYTEAEANAILAAWLETISEPFGIDHVTLRRMLVDARLLARSQSGSMYRLEAAKLARLPAVGDVDAGGLIALLQEERGRRKRLRAA